EKGVISATSPSSSTIPVNIRFRTPNLVRLRGSRLGGRSRRLQGRVRRLGPCGAERGGPVPRVLPPIRTFTVGTGIPPVQPADGFGRVADCHRRFGFSPTP